ncbi:MAG: hypothetical protein WAN58_06030 [Anaerolineales bacterium]
MNPMRRDISSAATWATILLMLALTACGTQIPTPPPVPNLEVVLATSAEITDQPVVAVTMTPVDNNAENQAAATAQFVRANAQATLDSANATVNAAQTQDQNNADAVAAQIAATAKVARSQAQATLVAAGSTQSVGLTQVAIQQTQEEYNFQITLAAGTQSVVALMTQQNQNNVAASTQTAVANNIATQTAVAVATSQWYADQARQSKEQSQIPIAFLWMWCLPIFILILAGLIIWGVWRWLRIQQANQRNPEHPVEKLQAPAPVVMHYQEDDTVPTSASEVVDSRFQLTKPEDPVSGWLDEVKRELRDSDKRDEDDDTTDN